MDGLIIVQLVTQQGRISFLSGQGTMPGNFDPNIPQLTLAAMIYRQGEDNTVLFSRNVFIRSEGYGNVARSGSPVDPYWMLPHFSSIHVTPFQKWRFVATVYDRIASTRRFYTIPFSYTDESQMTDSTNKQTVSFASNAVFIPITELINNDPNDADISNAYIIPAALTDTEVFDLFLQTKEIV